MIHLSLALNLLLLVPVLWGLMRNSPGSAAAFGPDHPARRIVTAVYLAIALISAGLLVWETGRQVLAPGLLAMQVSYKLVTLPFLGPRHPVALANLGIAAVHGVTLWSLTR
ncbi:MAG: hypothetical protein AAGE03_11905 [Pseudomonadota bacterium]